MGETVEVKTDGDEVPGDSSAPKLGTGKVKRRGKKKNKTSPPHAETEDSSEAKKIEFEEDQKLIKSYFESNSSNDLGPIKSWEEISSIAERIEKDQSLEGLLKGGKEAAGVDRETLEKFNKAVGRVTAHRREIFDEKIEAVRKRTAHLSAKEMIKLVESGSDKTPQVEQVEEVVVEEVVEAVVEEVEAEEEGECSAHDSKSSSSESDSDSDSDDSESSSEESSESSEGNESSSDEEPRPGLGDPNILRWYQHWYSGVAQQRQAIQTSEYYRYLQHYGYNH